MKGATVTLLGLFVIIAVIDSTQGNGYMKCISFMNAPNEEDKTLWKKCSGDFKADDADSDSDKKAKRIKFGACLVNGHKILVDGKFSKSNFDSLMDAKFKDSDKAAAIKKDVTTDCAKDGQEFKSDEELGKLMKCTVDTMKKACGGDS